MPWRSRMACTVLRNTALRRGERCPAAVSAAAIAWSLSPARARATMSSSISRLRDRSASEPTVTGTVASVVAPPRQTMRNGDRVPSGAVDDDLVDEAAQKRLLAGRGQGGLLP